MELSCLPPKPQAAMSTLSTRLFLRCPLPLLLTSSTTSSAASCSTAAASAVAAVEELPRAVVVPEPIIKTPLPQKAKPKRSTNIGGTRGSKVISEALLKENWLNSLSCPFPTCSAVAGSDWVIGIDPDTSGALALLKPDGFVEVYDSPHLMALVGKRQRKRLDAKSIVQLIQSFNAPTGITAYIEQSSPYPQDGKQGWWSGGFGYGLWIGILIASGISVVPVPSLLWKNEFKLSGIRASKDNCRELASTLFPSMSSMLKRKKDHGRAEALLIAAYGKGLSAPPDSSRVVP